MSNILIQTMYLVSGKRWGLRMLIHLESFTKNRVGSFVPIKSFYFRFPDIAWIIQPFCLFCPLWHLMPSNLCTKAPLIVINLHVQSINVEQEQPWLCWPQPPPPPFPCKHWLLNRVSTCREILCALSSSCIDFWNLPSMRKEPIRLIYA